MPKQVPVGRKAPTFSRKDVLGRLVNPEQLAGKKILLCFYRSADCSVSNLFLKQVMEHKKAWQEQGLIVINVFASDAKAVLKHQVPAQHQDMFFIADGEGQLYKRYGVTPHVGKYLLSILSPEVYTSLYRTPLTHLKPKGRRLFLIPADFLINRLGIVVTTHYGWNIGNHIPLQKIDSFVKQGSQPPPSLR